MQTDEHDKKYAIIMSKHLDQFRDDWAILVERISLGQIRKIKEPVGSPALLSRSEYDVSYVEPKLLINSETNQIEHGTVFQLTRK